MCSGIFTIWYKVLFVAHPKHTLTSGLFICTLQLDFIGVHAELQLVAL